MEEADPPGYCRRESVRCVAGYKSRACCPTVDDSPITFLSPPAARAFGSRLISDCLDGAMIADGRCAICIGIASALFLVVRNVELENRGSAFGRRAQKECLL